MEIIEEKFRNRVSIYQFIPKSFEYLTLKSNKKIVFTSKTGVTKNLKAVYLIDIIHTLMSRYFMNSKETIDLNSEVLRKKYSTYYNFYIEYLEDKKVISMHKNYCAGAKSRTYNINTDILKGDCLRYYNTDRLLIKKYKEMVINEIIKNLTNQNHISEYAMNRLISNLYDVTIDLEKAYAILDTMNSNIESYQKNLMSITAINQSILFHKLDSHGRFHTNFSVLKKEIRQECLFIDNEETAELDIQNSQPAFLLKILEDDMFDMKYPDCFNRYKSDVFRGVFYDILAGMVGISRNKCKKEIFKVFFGKQTYFNGDISTAMSNRYPELMRYIAEKKIEMNNHAGIAHLLQYKESRLIYSNIVEKIYREIPAIKLFTVHDISSRLY
jgi:hypothetical protein